MCLMGVVQKLFLACENRLPMKYIIPENIFDIPDIWVWSNMDGSYPILDQIFRRDHEILVRQPECDKVDRILI